MAFVLELHIYENIFNDPDYFILSFCPIQCLFPLIHQVHSACILLFASMHLHIYIHCRLCLLLSISTSRIDGKTLLEQDLDIKIPRSHDEFTCLFDTGLNKRIHAIPYSNHTFWVKIGSKARSLLWEKKKAQSRGLRNEDAEAATFSDLVSERGRSRVSNESL